ncbi:twin-arginine translocation signal domain-containing protein, partial [Mycobacterium rufum]|nr:twin-arginine translocation signal domain-containing protein [Mycolicibacterium rufum]
MHDLPAVPGRSRPVSRRAALRYASAATALAGLGAAALSSG